MDVSGSFVGLWALRHAETKSNQSGTFMGSLDVPANPESLQLAKSIGSKLRKEFHRAYASPLSRATETARAIFPDESIVIDDRLRERSLGQWEGMRVAEVRERSPEAFVSGHMDARYTPPGGETFTEMRNRIIEFVNFLATQDEPEKILVVSHNGWIRTTQNLVGCIAVQDIYLYSIPQLEPIRINKIVPPDA
ncbi:histidine phosphatase family protein [Saccharothrix stipae]